MTTGHMSDLCVCYTIKEIKVHWFCRIIIICNAGGNYRGFKIKDLL